MAKEKDKNLERVRAEYKERVKAIFDSYERLLPIAKDQGLAREMGGATSISLLDELSLQILFETQVEEVSLPLPIALFIFQKDDCITHVNTCVGMKQAKKGGFHIVNAILEQSGGEWQVERSTVSLSTLAARLDEDASVTLHELTVKRLENLVEHVQ